MTQMLAFQFKSKEGDLERTEVPIPEPGPYDVLIKVKASGICHSDVFVKYITPTFPRTPGHEVAGVVEKVGEKVKNFKTGDRAACGWNGGWCGTCRNCREGEFFACETHAICGATFNGGYAQYLCAPENAVAKIPEGMSFEEAAPLMCAGVTTYNALRHSCAKPGDVVAILGVGGLGHLGVQFARAMGFVTVAIARGQEKKSKALKLGAHYYIDSTSQDVAAELQKLGGAKVVISTVVKSSAMTPCLAGLRPHGELLLCGIDEKMEVPIAPMVGGQLKVIGHYSGLNVDSEDCMKFAQRFGIHSMNEYFPFEDAKKGLDAMLEGKVNLRGVLKF